MQAGNQRPLELCFLSAGSSLTETDNFSSPPRSRRPPQRLPSRAELAGASSPPSPGVRGDAGPATCAAASRPSSSKAAAARGREGASERGKGVLLPAQGQRCGLRRVRRSPPRLH